MLVALLLAGATLRQLPAQEREGEDAHEEHHANSIGLFLGASTAVGDVSEGSATTSFTLGAGYERRVSELLGLGLLVDFAFGDFERAALLGVPLFIHPTRRLRLVAAPAVEIEEVAVPHQEIAAESSEEEPSEAESGVGFAFRVGLAYELELGEGWSLTPEFNTDFFGGHTATLVYGLAVEYGF